MSRKKACSGLDSGVDTGLLPAQFAAGRRRGAPYIANLRISIVAFAAGGPRPRAGPDRRGNEEMRE